MVSFDVKADFTQVDKMLKRYGSKATREYSKAVKNTVIHGYRIAPERTEGIQNGVLKKSWKYQHKGLFGTLFNKQEYSEYVNDGWRRTSTLILDKPIAFKLKHYKGSSKRTSMKVLFDKRSNAMKKLAGKGFSQKEKNMIVTHETGIAVGRKFKPARFRGYHFIEKRILPSLQKRLDMEVTLVNRRLVA